MKSWFHKIIRRHGDKICVYPHTYQDLDRLSQIQQKKLFEKNYRPGGRICISDQNGIQFLANLKAVWDMDGVPYLIPPTMPWQTQQSLHKIMGKIPIIYETEALTVFTTGTTSLIPKGVRLSHTNLLSHGEMLNQHISLERLGPMDRTLAILPWTHCYGLMGECLSMLERGGEMRVLTKAFSSSEYLMGILKTQPTVLFLVPKILELLLKKDEELRSYGLPLSFRRGFLFGTRLRYIVSGGAFLSPQTIQDFHTHLKVEVFQGYGCSEMSPMIALQRDFMEGGYSVGEILDGVEVKIKGDGEIVVRGPNRFMGYSGESLIDKNSFYETGDFGRLVDNRLYITGRKSDVVKLSNGKFISIPAWEKELAKDAKTEICLWQTEKGKWRGIVSGEGEIKSDGVEWRRTSENFTMENGRKTLKGELCRAKIRKDFEHLFG